MRSGLVRGRENLSSRLSLRAPGQQLIESGRVVTCCLFVNCLMPAMNRLELVARLRDRNISIPVILVSGHPNENLRSVLPLVRCSWSKSHSSEIA
jgi:CheY-like chemotaxis protein